MTLWASQNQIKLHWNKVRGQQFEPCHFRIEQLSCPDIVDDMRRQIMLPVMRPCTERDAEERAAQESNSQAALLKAIIENAKGTQRDWAMKIGKSVATVAKTLKKLEKAKLVRNILDKWQVTPTGRKAALE